MHTHTHGQTNTRIASFQFGFAYSQYSPSVRSHVLENVLCVRVCLQVCIRSGFSRQNRIVYQAQIHGQFERLSCILNRSPTARRKKKKSNK